MSQSIEPLLTLDDGAAVTRQPNADAFSRFCKRHGIPLVRFSRKMVRVRSEDLRAAIERHVECSNAEDHGE